MVVVVMMVVVVVVGAHKYFFDGDAYLRTNFSYLKK